MSTNTTSPIRDLTLRKIALADVEAVAALHERQNMRPADRAHIERCVVGFPGVVCCDGDRIIGFAYTTSFAPDILNLTNILVEQERRGQGLGTLLLTDIEEQAKLKWTGIILSNSELWNHPPRTSPLSFYFKNKYSVISETEHTSVLFKDLAALG